MVTLFDNNYGYIRSNRWMANQRGARPCACGSNRTVMNRVLLRRSSRYFVNCERCEFKTNPARSLKGALKKWNKAVKKLEEFLHDVQDA